MPTPIYVIHGSCDGQFDHIAGRTVGEMRKALASIFNIPSNAITFANCEQAKASYLLKPGDRVEFVKPARKKNENARRKQRITMIGCGQIAKCLIHPLLWHLDSVPYLDAQIRAVDGDEAKVSTLIEAEGQVVPIPENLVAANAGRIIEEGDVVLACTSNQSTLKLISAHVQKLANVTVVAGGCDYLDRAVMFFVRRKGKNLTLPLASHYHPELLKPTDRNPGEVAVDKTMPPSTPKAVVNVNMVAAVMLAALRRLMTEEFPDPCEFYIEANLPRVVLRERFPSKSERRNSAGNLRLPADHRMQPVLGTEERGLARRGGSEWWKISGFVCQMWECPTTFRIVGRQPAIGGLQIHDCRWRIGSVEKFGKQP
jgi:hypothetical protein